MERRTIQIHSTPAIIWGTSSKRLYLYIHGQGGCKEEAEAFANIACRNGWQVLSIDLPEHGDRKSESNSFDPWHIIPELSAVMEYAKCRWGYISLLANSIGAWFSMLSFKDERLRNCLFISPVLDMKQLISSVMKRANISEARLKQELVIPTSFGQTLSWKYWEYASNHPIMKWEVSTKILYGENDNMIERDIVNRFVHKFNCDLTVMENGEHWFHTEQQIDVLCRWVEKSLKNKDLPPNDKKPDYKTQSR